MSELAGARWPNVTQDDIFTWHDAETTPPDPANNYLAMKEVIRKLLPGEEMSEAVCFDFDCCWFENGRIENFIQSLPHLCSGFDLTDDVAASIENQWIELRKISVIDKYLIDFKRDHPATGIEKRNIFSFWYFFLKFIAFRYATGLRGNNIDKNHEDFSKELNIEKCSDVSSLVFMNNLYFMLPHSQLKGFSNNETNQVRLLFLFDENGRSCIPARINTESGEWEAHFTEIKKENLLLKASSVRLIEEIVPEITSKTFQVDEIGTTLQRVDDTKKYRSHLKADRRRESSDLKLIATLKEIILERTELKSQEQIIDFIESDERFKNKWFLTIFSLMLIFVRKIK
ncbi:MAG: hypothetical protein Q4G66_05055, partial [bacterium]|nr:hypothetical protein [bacterium]